MSACKSMRRSMLAVEPTGRSRQNGAVPALRDRQRFDSLGEVLSKRWRETTVGGGVLTGPKKAPPSAGVDPDLPGGREGVEDTSDDLRGAGAADLVFQLRFEELSVRQDDT